jgi:predicted amidophosphoribosyltransferase
MSRIAPGSNVHDVSAGTAHDRCRCAVQSCAPADEDRPVPPPPITVLLHRAAELAVPTACLACRTPAGRAGEALCPACRRALPWLREAPRPPGGAGALQRGATASRRATGPDLTWAPLAHEGPARALVHALKFRGALGVAGVMAAQIAANAPPRLLDGATLVPVPAPAARRRARGFDHAARLATALGGRTGRPVAACLRRAGPGPRQVGARRAARLADGRVAVVARGAVPPVVALVDDVETTGATLAACAGALRAAGARRVVAVTYARARRSSPIR